MPESYKPAKRKSHLRLALAAIPVSALLFLGGTVASRAFTPNVAEEFDHFVECFGWMITDPDMHNAECAPGRAVGPDSPVSSGGGADPVVEFTSPPPPPED